MSAICRWNDIKTVLLDVDGTLLDLHFDIQSGMTLFQRHLLKNITSR